MSEDTGQDTSGDVNRQAAQAAADSDQGVEAPGSASAPTPPTQGEDGDDRAGGAMGSTENVTS